MAETEGNSGPDLGSGIALADLPDGSMLRGRVDAEDAILIRRGDALYAVGAHCTHYHGPLADGLVVGDTVRCPWHHACFSLRTHNLLATDKVRDHALTEHRALIAAFAKGDLERAEDVLAEHVLRMRIRYRTQRGREPAAESA